MRRYATNHDLFSRRIARLDVFPWLGMALALSACATSDNTSEVATDPAFGVDIRTQSDSGVWGSATPYDGAAWASGDASIAAPGFDAAISSTDSSFWPSDSGPVPVDSGAVASDGGFRPADAGSRTPDGGSRLPDSGVVTRDSGIVTRDSGIVSPDSGIVSPDSGVVSPDSGVVAASPGQWVMGYHPGYEFDSYPVTSIDWSGLTHIIFATVAVKADYSLDLTFYAGSEAQGKARATQIADAAHAHGVKALLMLGGAGVGNIKQAIEHDTAGFAKSLTDAMTSLHYDGIDLDIEDGSPLTDVVALAKALRQGQPNMILTYPGAPIQLGTKVDAQTVELAKYLDRYATQSYYGGGAGLFTGTDYTGTAYFKSWFTSALSGATTLTPYAIDVSLAALAAAGIPKSKLAMGIAFYATCYKIPDTTVPGGKDIVAPRMDAYATSSYCWDCGTGGGDNAFPLSAFFSATGRLSQTSAAEQKRDAVAKEPYLSLSSAVNESHCGGSTRYITYEDETSILDKGSFSKSNGYGGIIIWTLSQGLLPQNATGGRSPNALTQALKHGFLDP